MAMSRTKSFLPHTQKNLWRTDIQHDLTVTDPIRTGRVRAGVVAGGPVDKESPLVG